MEAGEITSYIDVAQVVLYAFWIFFAGLVLYLRREDKREGYPLLSDRSGQVRVQGYPPIPDPKYFHMQEGHVISAPQTVPERTEIAARPWAPWPGAPLQPTGNPLVDGVGPAAWAARRDEPELTWEGIPAIVPLRIATDAFVEPRDANPIGMPVVAADGAVAGTVREIWTDRSEPQIRYLEVEVPSNVGDQRHVLVPMPFVRISAKQGLVKVKALLARQFAEIPGLKSPDQITKLEEDKITGYFAGGHLYATPQRLGPYL